MAQEMSVEELRRIAALHKGMTPESWLMDWAAGEIERLRTAIRQTLDENGHLADGDNCTMIALKRAMPEWEAGK